MDILQFHKSHFYLIEIQRVDAARIGEAFGPDRVRSQLQISAPGIPLGIIAQRTASITWREQRQDDKGYRLNDIDPITGEQRYPFLRWDDDGMPFSANPSVWQPDPTDPGIRAAITQQLETMNLIAPCAVFMRDRGLNDAQTCGTAWEFTGISDYYEFNSGLRRFYAGCESKPLIKVASNDCDWRIVV
jgi:hypothetical protein